MEELKKKKWYKTWWGILLLVLFWPISVTYFVWKSHWSQSLKLGIIALIWGVGLIAYISNQINTKPTALPDTAMKTTSNVVDAKVQNTPTSTPKVNTNDSYNQQLFEAMRNVGEDKTAYVETDSGHIQAIQQNDGSWVIVKIHNGWPELAVSLGVKSMTFEFIKAMYAPEFEIKQAGMTINAPKNIGNKYYRAFLGANQAKYLSKDDWSNTGPSNFYEWLKSMQTSRDENDRSNSTFVEEQL